MCEKLFARLRHIFQAQNKRGKGKIMVLGTVIIIVFQNVRIVLGSQSFGDRKRNYKRRLLCWFSGQNNPLVFVSFWGYLFN
jgi:hypothetical protein